MTVTMIDDNIYVSGQIAPGDIKGIAGSGIKVIIDNRPDGEEAAQPTFAQIEAEAKTYGLSAYYVPVVPGQSMAEPARALLQILGKTDDDVLMYCRSGSRSAHLWGLSQSGRQSPEQILKKAQQAGYDIGAIAPSLKPVAKPDN